jgi:hypothetical protein
MDINALLNLLGNLFQNGLVHFEVNPSLEVSPKLEVNLKLADMITMSVHLNTHNEQTAIAFLTAHKTELAGNKNSINLVAETDRSKSSDQSLIPSKAPFSNGIHLIIDQAEWWENPKPFTLGQLKIVPLELNKQSAISTLRPGENACFTVCLSESDNWLACIPEGTKQFQIDFSNDRPYQTGQSDSEWRFYRYSPDQYISFKGLPQIILSLDKRVAKLALVIERSHSSLHKDEYYALVVAANDEQ